MSCVEKCRNIISNITSSQNCDENDAEGGRSPLLDHENEVPKQYRIGKYDAHQWVHINFTWYPNKTKNLSNWKLVDLHWWEILSKSVGKVGISNSYVFKCPPPNLESWPNAGAEWNKVRIVYERTRRGCHRYRAKRDPQHSAHIPNLGVDAST